MNRLGVVAISPQWPGMDADNVVAVTQGYAPASADPDAEVRVLHTGCYFLARHVPMHLWRTETRSRPGSSHDAASCPQLHTNFHCSLAFKGEYDLFAAMLQAPIRPVFLGWWELHRTCTAELPAGTVQFGCKFAGCVSAWFLQPACLQGCWEQTHAVASKYRASSVSC